MANTARQEWHDGWGVVLAAALGIALGGIHTHFIGTMIKPLQAVYDWSRGEIAFGLTLIMAIHLVGNILAGVLADRLGTRIVALWGLWLFGLGFSLIGLAGPEIWTWLAACTFFGIASMFVTPVVWTAGVVKWFSVQRGMALAMCLTGGGLMVAVTPTLVIWLVRAVGVNWIFPVVGATSALLMFIPTLAWFRDRAPRTQPSAGAVSPTANPVSPGAGYGVSEALRARRFWQLLLALAFVALAVGTFLVHIQPMLIDSGLSPGMAASVAFFIGPSMIVGRLFMGMLFDLYDTRLIAGAAFLLPCAASLLLFALNGGYGIAVAAGLVVGLCLGAEVDVIAYMASRYFGLRSYGTIFAMMMSGYGLFIGAGSAIAGMAYDIADSYRPWLLLLCAGSILASLLICTLGRPPGREGDPQSGHADIRGSKNGDKSSRSPVLVD
jgi:MFS family permease